MQQLKWMILRFIERLGVVGNIVLLLAAFCIGYTCFVLIPTQTALAVIESQTNAQNHAPIDIVSSKPTPSKAEQLQAFTQRFPPLANRTASVQKIMALAQSMKLAVDEISYKTEQRPDDVLTHYYIDFSVIASYPSTREFLGNVLASLPNASIEAINFSRENTSDELVTTRVRLTLHFAS